MIRQFQPCAVAPLVLTLLVTCAATRPASPAPNTTDIPPEWRKPVKPFRIVGDVYYVGSEGLAAYLIRSPQSAVLLDGTLAENAPMVERNIQALGVPLHDVKFLLSDHAHHDHVGALAQIQRDTGASVAAGAGDQWALEHGRSPGEVTYRPVGYPPVKVDRPVRDGDTVKVGPIVMTAHITAGHTPGCTSWSLDVPDGGHPVSVLFLCSLTVAGNVLVGNTAYPNIVADYRATFRKLSAMKADVVLSSHPEITDVFGREAKRRPGQPNPFIDPSLLQTVVTKARAAFEASLAKAQGGQSRPRSNKGSPVGQAGDYKFSRSQAAAFTTTLALGSTGAPPR